MTFKEWINNDKVSLGIILGLVLPIPVTMVFAALLRIVQYNLHVFTTVRDANLLLLGIAANLFVMRYYLVKLKFEKTGKTLLVLTVFMILMFFLFLKNSNFTLPF